MKRIALALWISVPLFFAAPCHADDADNVANLGTPVDTIGFFESVKGNYKILKAGGAPPHQSNALGTVERESGQSVLTFGYCPPTGGCDPGYIFLDDVKTKVMRQDVANGQVYNIVTVDAGKTYRYEWQAGGGQVIFRNLQYQMPDGKIVTLEHVLQKARGEDGD